MSKQTKIANNFIKNAKKLSSAAKWLYVLIQHRAQQGILTLPTHQEIEPLTRWSVPVFESALEELAQLGWVKTNPEE